MAPTKTDVLRSRGCISGSYVRPVGSDSWPPKAGTRVDYVLSQPIQDLVDQGKRLGWENKGTIGNVNHLKLHGDHTGHSAGKMRGVIYAKDTALPKGGKDALLWLCKQEKYDTTWIDFFNVDGSQYNYAGTRVGSSTDVHLHISVKNGYELLPVWLFDDIAAVIAGTYGRPPMPTAFDKLGFIDGAELLKDKATTVVYLAGRDRKVRLKDNAEITAVQTYLRSRNMNAVVLTVATVPGVAV